MPLSTKHIYPGHTQFLITAAILFGMGFQTILIALVADLLSTNRKMLEDIRFRMLNGDELPITRKRKNHS